MRHRKKTPVVILVRVSTAKQETNRQVSELLAYAKAKGYEVVEVCRETISGAANGDERHGLKRAQALALEGKIKKVLVHEISRLARRNSVAHQFVETLEDCGVSLYWHAQGVETLLPNGKRNPAAGIMLALLAEMARGEIETLRERINSGLREAKRKGVKLGSTERDDDEPGGVSPDTQRHLAAAEGRTVGSQRREDHWKRRFNGSKGKVSPRQSNSIIAVAGK